MTAAPPPDRARSAADSVIALAVVRALREGFGPRAHALTVDVENGRVSLAGELAHDHDRREAVSLVAAIAGVREVDDRIAVGDTACADLAVAIRRALVGLALDDARALQISVDGSTVRLRGRVHSALQRDAVARAVADAPGVTRVINELLLDD